MEQKKKILILTADAGFGHRSAANAINEALVEKYSDRVTVDIVNPLDEKSTPSFLRDSQTDYDRWVHNVPELYQLGYQASDSLVPTVLLERYLAIFLTETMRDLMKEYKPDLVVTTYPLYQSALSTLFRSKKYRVPFFSAVTDLSTVHRLWFNKRATGCLVPNKLVAELAMSYGMPTQKISITGIPINPAISRETRSKNKIRKELGWEPNIPTILAVGSKRVDRLLDTLNVVNHFGNELQLAVVAGKDEGIYQQLTQIEWHIKAHIFDFVDNMSTLMKASDLIVCKAGGLIVTESLACGLPMILIEIIPGQETGNAEYVTAYGAADMAQSPVEVLEVLSHLMRNKGALLKKRSENANLLGQPKSAYTASEILMKALDEHPEKRKSSSIKKLTV